MSNKIFIVRNFSKYSEDKIKKVVAHMPDELYRRDMVFITNITIGHAYKEKHRKMDPELVRLVPLGRKIKWYEEKLRRQHKPIRVLLICSISKIEEEYYEIKDYWDETIIFLSTTHEYLTGEQALQDPRFFSDRYISCSNSDSKKNPAAKLDYRNMYLPHAIDYKWINSIDMSKNEHNVDTSNVLLYREPGSIYVDERLQTESEDFRRTSDNNLLLRGTGNTPSWEAEMAINAFKATQKWIAENPEYAYIFDDIDTEECIRCGNHYKWNWVVDYDPICPVCRFNNRTYSYATDEEFINNSRSENGQPDWYSDFNNDDVESSFYEDDREYIEDEKLSKYDSYIGEKFDDDYGDRDQ